MCLVIWCKAANEHTDHSECTIASTIPYFHNYIQECIVLSSYLMELSANRATHTYLGELDFFLVDHPGRGGVSPAVYQPAPVPHQDHIGLLLRLCQTTGQRVPHLVLQGSSIGVNLKISEYQSIMKAHNKVPMR